MDVLDEDLLNFWRCLNKHKVLYIMVGGFATNLNGYTRYTADLDIWLKDTLENRKKFRLAYAESGNGDIAELETTQFIPGWTKLYLNNLLELDLLTDLVSFSQNDFDTCFQNASIAKIHDVEIKYLHLNDLILEKRKSRRAKDLLDLEELTKILQAKNKK